MKPKPRKLSEQIRQAVDASELSRYRISKSLGIAESTMSRFMAGGGLSMCQGKAPEEFPAQDPDGNERYAAERLASWIAW